MLAEEISLKESRNRYGIVLYPDVIFHSNVNGWKNYNNEMHLSLDYRAGPELMGSPFIRVSDKVCLGIIITPFPFQKYAQIIPMDLILGLQNLSKFRLYSNLLNKYNLITYSPFVKIGPYVIFPNFDCISHGIYLTPYYPMNDNIVSYNNRLKKIQFNCSEVLNFNDLLKHINEIKKATCIKFEWKNKNIDELLEDDIKILIWQEPEIIQSNQIVFDSDDDDSDDTCIF
jgi:hypothetical protein